MRRGSDRGASHAVLATMTVLARSARPRRRRARRRRHGRGDRRALRAHRSRCRHRCEQGGETMLGRSARLRGRAHQHRRARSRGQRPRAADVGRHRAAASSGASPLVASVEAHAGAGVRRSRCCASRVGRRRSRVTTAPPGSVTGWRSATSAFPPRPTAACASTSRDIDPARFVSAIDVLEGKVDPPLCSSASWC